MIIKISSFETTTSFSFTTITNSNSEVIVKYNSDFLTKDFLYFTQINDEIFLSDDFYDIAFLKKEKSTIEIEDQILSFFVSKGYAPFHYTLFKGIYKLPNLNALVVNKKTLEWRFELLLSHPVSLNEDNIVEDAIATCLDNKKVNIVLFSGGYDSTLLAMVAKKYLKVDQLLLVTGQITGVDFIPNSDDVIYSQKLAKQLGLKIDMVNVPIGNIDTDDLDEIIFNKPNCAHFSINFQHIAKKYPSDIYNVISGQQADSILNFGSTSFLKFKNYHLEGVGELLRRFIYLSKASYSKILFKVLNKGLDPRFVQLSLLLGHKKFPLVKNKSQWVHFANAYELFLSKFSSKDMNKILSSNHLFYTLSFISGSDAFSVLKTFHSTKSSLPFNKISLVSYYINKKYSFLDKWIPKRVVMRFIKKERALWNIISERPNTPNISYLQIFNVIAKKNDLENYFNESTKKYHLNIPFCYNSYHICRVLDKINS